MVKGVTNSERKKKDNKERRAQPRLTSRLDQGKRPTREKKKKRKEWVVCRKEK